jgi:hypothetical protein
MNEEFEAARRSGDVKKQRDLRPKVQNAYNQTQQLGEQIIQSRQYLIITQYLHYQAGNEVAATELAQEINSMMLNTPFPALPTTKEESEAEIQRYGIL